LFGREGKIMSYWIHLRDDVLYISVAFLIVIMYLFYVKYPCNKEMDSVPR
jgi:hypothetical protein